jgi:acetyltransferase-like isoleucine patch superfamily enzyme
MGRFLHSNELRKIGFKIVGNNVRVHETCNIPFPENIIFGNNIRIDAFCSVITPSKFFTIGNFVHIASHCVLSLGEGAIFQDFSSISSHVSIYSQSDDFNSGKLTNSLISEQFKSVNKSFINLGKHSIVGTQSILLPGAILREGSALGANSMTNRTLDSWSIYSGNPARKIAIRQKINESEIKSFLESDFEK